MQFGRMQSCVRPVCAAYFAAGPNAIRGSGPKQKHALVVRPDPNGFSRPSVLDRFCITSQSLRQTRELPAAVALKRDRGRLPIGPTVSQERPGDAGVLVGQRHGRDLGRLVGNDLGKPWIGCAASPSDDRISRNWRPCLSTPGDSSILTALPMWPETSEELFARDALRDFICRAARSTMGGAQAVIGPCNTG